MLKRVPRQPSEVNGYVFNWNLKGRIRKGRVDWLALDSWIDSSLYGAWEQLRNVWSSYSSFFSRFHVSGLRRVLAEAASESLTLGAGGLVVMLALALPAFEEVNDSWRTSGEFSVTFLDRYGNEIGKRGILHSDAVPLADIPDHMIQAALATEDRRFFDHFGIDIIGTARAMVENVRANDVVQGGSSLTQQLAKNFFLSPERSLQRKIKEAYLALWLEARLTKKEILKYYLDRSYMGGGAFGVEAASQLYFNKSVRDITLSEAAMLAGLFKAPSRFAPHINLPASRARANVVLSNLVEAGFMTEGQVHGARLNPATIIDRSDFYSPDWFLDYAFEEVQRLMKDKGAYVLTAQTTVDLSLQRNAQEAVENTLRKSGRGRRARQAALVSMEPDGAVRVIVGGRDYGESQFNRATHARRQPGSSFKPYVYLTALENGYTPNSAVVDGYVSCGRWSPRNYSGGYRGRMIMAHALMRSINTVAVKLSLKVGREKVVANAKKLGLDVRKSCSMALGDTGITPLQHTAGYSVFAAGGKRTPPYVIEEIRNSKDELIYLHERDEPPAKQIFERKKIEQLNSMLGLVVTSGTGRRAQLDFTTSAGKTGTSSGFRDAWFMGFTGQYVTGVWFGNDNFTPMARVTGGSLPAQTWKDFMVYAHATRNIPPIPGLGIHPNQAQAQDQISRLKQADPSLGTIASSVRRMSPRTRKVLRQMRELFKDARAGGVQDRRAAVPGNAGGGDGAPPLPDEPSDNGRRSEIDRDGRRLAADRARSP